LILWNLITLAHKNIYEHHKTQLDKEEIIAIYNKPMMDLLYEAASIHREHHDQTWFRFQHCPSKQVVAGRLRLLPTSRKIPHFGEGNDLMG
jgi:hypothetical protein